LAVPRQREAKQSLKGKSRFFEIVLCTALECAWIRDILLSFEKSKLFEKGKSGKMNEQELSQLSDNELLEEFKKIVPSPIFDAFFIGFLVGIVVFGITVSAWGFTILIPLFLVYLFLKKAKRYEALKKELASRNLL
jgi:hypothetical protein